MKKYEIPTIMTITNEVSDIELVQQVAAIESLIQPSDAWNSKTISDMLTQDIYRCWVAVDSHEKDDVNIIAYCIWSDVFEVVEILRIGTHPDYQRQGLAYGLIRALQKYSARKDLPEPVERVLLEVREDNIAAIKLYEKMGFKLIDRRRNYYKSNDKNHHKKHDKNATINDVTDDKKQNNIESTESTCDALIMQYTVDQRD